MATKSVSYDLAMSELYKQHPEAAIEMLHQCIAEGDHEMLLVTLRHLAKNAGGIEHVSSATGFHENTLYRTLSRRGNPSLRTLMLICGALGMRMQFSQVNTQ